MSIFVSVELAAKGYANTHDGYCSGAECEYEEYDKIETFVHEFTPTNFRYFMTDCISFPLLLDEVAERWFEVELRALDAKYEGKCDGSGYCRNDPIASAKDISQHSTEIHYSQFKITRIRYTLLRH